AAVARARADARAVIATVGRLAALCAGAPPPAAEGQPMPSRPPAPQDGAPPPAGRPPAPPLPALVDFEVWLTSLTAQLAHVENGLTGMPHHRAPGGRRSHR
ncbi:hypothetical protein PYK79_50135, partial [Streptomyces sp. ID05-04B]|nr:hypothetical protein [Streptomyces sp. ID05-04B]